MKLQIININFLYFPGSIHESVANPFIGQPTPKFISRGNTFRVVTGDTVILPCEVQNLGE